MATKTNKRNNLNSQSSTKVICSNCGAEIIIPAHEQRVSGVAIGKDSGLGTVVLPTSTGPSNQPSLHDAIAVVAASFGAAAPNGNASPIDMVADLITKIQDEGYIDVSNIVRRWIPSQCVTMLQNPHGFHYALQCRGIDYSWSVLLADLKRQMELFASKDTEGYQDRNRWYNRKVALAMAEDFFLQLQKEVSNMPHHKHQGREYVKLVCNLNCGRGVHIDELNDFYLKIGTLIEKIRKATHPKTLFNAVDNFNDLRSSIRMCFNPSQAFMNAYKAAGAYYTMKDFILFEGFKMKVDGAGSTDYRIERYNSPNKRRFVEQEESLAALERKASAIVSRGVCDFGYELLGLLKDFLNYNHFNYAETRDKWAHQSEARRLMRALNGNRRPRK